MGEHYSHLSLAERRRIDEMFQASILGREIAARGGATSLAEWVKIILA